VTNVNMTEETDTNKGVILSQAEKDCDFHIIGMWRGRETGRDAKICDAGKKRPCP